MLKFSRAITLCVLAAAVRGAVAAAADEPVEIWHFSVLLDGKRIGEHDFTVTRQGDVTEVATEAHFRVKAAFISLYHYEHQDHENWRGDCLANITARTDDNGKALTVDGALRGNSFQVRSSHAAATLPACIRTFAYWDQHLLTDAHLLNSQTGEYQAVTFERAQLQSVRVSGQMVQAQRYSLRAPKLDISLWYSLAGRWVALESRLESGRVLRYEMQ